MRILNGEKSSARALRERGSGTVEMTLLIIAAIGAMIWGVGKISLGADEVTTREQAKRVAIEIVRVTDAAKVAGVDLVQKGSLMGTVNRVEKGETITFGYFKGEYYSVDKIDPEVKARLDDFLYLDRGRLRLIE